MTAEACQLKILTFYGAIHVTSAPHDTLYISEALTQPDSASRETFTWTFHPSHYE